MRGGVVCTRFAFLLFDYVNYIMFPTLCESTCIAAAAAQLLRRVAAGKAVVYSPGAFAAQNFIQRAFKEIAEGEITPMVKDSRAQQSRHRGRLSGRADRSRTAALPPSAALISGQSNFFPGSSQTRSASAKLPRLSRHGAGKCCRSRRPISAFRPSSPFWFHRRRTHSFPPHPAADAKSVHWFT